MQSVSSNAVREAIGEWEVVKTDNSTYIIRGKETSEGTFLQGHFQGTPQSTVIFLPQKYRPKVVTRFFGFESTYSRVWFVNILSDGSVNFSTNNGTFYSDFLVRIEKDI